MHGNIKVLGSKNAALALLSATLLSAETSTLKNIPDISDVENMIHIFKAMGVHIKREKDQVDINAAHIDPKKMPPDKVGLLRGSILLLGALLGRNRQVSLPLPGGDIIGARPIDVHLDAFRQLGAVVTTDDGGIHVDGANLKPGRVILSEFSVTATENTMLVAAGLPGTTTIEIAAAEPHVRALADILNLMGARVNGGGTHTIVIEGTTGLTGADFTNIPDILEAGFFILLGAVTKSDLTIHNVPTTDMLLFMKKLYDIGLDYNVAADSVHVRPSELKQFKVQTLPQPGIATDLQAPFSVVATQADGTSLIHDPMYESRFRHCDELTKMGAVITVCDPHRVIIQGPTLLHGRHIKSLDIRSGATLIMAGLVASGETIIDDAEIIDRGYENLDYRLRQVEADIKRIEA